MIFRIICVLIGCLFGNFQSSYILVRAFRGKDIRSVGSHNAGTMNRILNEGAAFGIATFLLDVLKTVLASALCLYIFGGEDKSLVLAYAGLGAALGHEFPFWLRFKGGKGVAVALAFLIMFDYRILILSVVFAMLVMLIMRARFGGDSGDNERRGVLLLLRRDRYSRHGSGGVDNHTSHSESEAVLRRRRSVSFTHPMLKHGVPDITLRRSDASLGMPFPFVPLIG